MLHNWLEVKISICINNRLYAFSTQNGVGLSLSTPSMAVKNLSKDLDLTYRIIKNQDH